MAYSLTLAVTLTVTLIVIVARKLGFVMVTASAASAPWLPDISYPNLFVPRHFVPRRL